MNHKLRVSLGFTLIELLVTLSIIAIISSIAIPSFISTVDSNRVTTYTNDFVTTLNFARSEAIKREYRVVVRKLDDNLEWENGWHVFVDYNADNDFDSDGDDTLCEPAVGGAVQEDCELMVSSGLPSPYTLRGSNFTNYIAYYSNGMNNVQGSFMLCKDKDGSHTPKAYVSRLISVNRIGRLRIAQDTDSNGIPNTSDTGNPNVDSCVSPFA